MSLRCTPILLSSFAVPALIGCGVVDGLLTEQGQGSTAEVTGSPWQRMESGTTANLQAISAMCVSRGQLRSKLPCHMTIVGDGGTVLTRVDDGPWTPQVVPATSDLHALIPLEAWGILSIPMFAAAGTAGTILIGAESGWYQYEGQPPVDLYGIDGAYPEVVVGDGGGVFSMDWESASEEVEQL